MVTILKDNIELIVLGIVLVTTAPVIIKVLPARKITTDPPAADIKFNINANQWKTGKTSSVFSIVVIVAALGYFVDIYDLVAVCNYSYRKSSVTGSYREIN